MRKCGHNGDRRERPLQHPPTSATLLLARDQLRQQLNRRLRDHRRVDGHDFDSGGGTPLDLAMRDSGLYAFAIAGIALEVGIEPTIHHAMDLGYIPVVVADACAAWRREAAARSLVSLQFTGGSYQTDVATIGRLMRARAVA